MAAQNNRDHAHVSGEMRERSHSTEEWLHIAVLTTPACQEKCSMMLNDLEFAYSPVRAKARDLREYL
jgi:hypothetical protein